MQKVNTFSKIWQDFSNSLRKNLYRTNPLDVNNVLLCAVVKKRKFILFILFFLLNQGPFCQDTDCSYFGLRVTLPMGFKARVVPLYGEHKGHTVVLHLPFPPIWCTLCE